MSQPHLPHIIKAIKNDGNPKLQDMAASAIQQLSKDELNRSILCRTGILKVLVNTLKRLGAPLDRTLTVRNIIISIFRLISGDGMPNAVTLHMTPAPQTSKRKRWSNTDC